jgi:hypothetical protein
VARQLTGRHGAVGGCVALDGSSAEYRLRSVERTRVEGVGARFDATWRDTQHALAAASTRVGSIDDITPQIGAIAFSCTMIAGIGWSTGMI